MGRYDIFCAESFFDCFIYMCFAVSAHHSFYINCNFYHSFWLLFFYIIIIFYFNGSSLFYFFVFSCIVNFKQVQTKGICNDAEAGEAHCCSAKHRVECPAENRDPDTGSERNTDDIVEKCPEKIFVDIFQGSTAETDRSRNITQAALHQDNIGSVDCNICSGTDRDSDISPCKSRSIVDTVTDHGNFALLLQGADHAFFAIRENSGNDIVHACLSTDCSCGTFVVTGQHNYADAHVLKFSDCLWAVFFDNISDCNNSDQFAVSCKKEGSFSLFGKFLCFPGESGRNTYLAADKFHTSTDQGFIIQHSGKTISGKCMEIGNFRCSKVQVFGMF